MKILEILDPKREIIDYLLHREHCTLVDGILVKDLDRVGRDIFNIVIVDNCIETFQLHPQNGLLIKSFVGQPDDSELVLIQSFLKELRKEKDVRCVSKRFEQYKRTDKWKRQFFSYNEFFKRKNYTFKS